MRKTVQFSAQQGTDLLGFSQAFSNGRCATGCGDFPAGRDALESWLASMRALRGASDNTLSAYNLDVTGFLAFMSVHLGQSLGLSRLVGVNIRDMRAWMAAEREQGVSSRSLARKLSAVKSFYRWLSDRVRTHAVLSTRASKFQKKLPA